MHTLLFLANLLWPVTGPITQYPSAHHPAVDIACLPGSLVRAAHSGTVRTRWSHDLGNVVEVDGETYRSLYAHLNSVERVKVVRQGDSLGTCGNTGRLSTGPHLHLEITLK
jgi:murein DD-endopeptidase MepM/ murein hydrolase activator NlpD